MAAEIPISHDQAFEEINQLFSEHPLTPHQVVELMTHLTEGGFSCSFSDINLMHITLSSRFGSMHAARIIDTLFQRGVIVFDRL